MNNKFTYKRLATRIRPPRCVTFININDIHWKASVLNIINRYSNEWGGLFNIIIPTDGNKIKKEFWEILTNYNPDYLFQFSADVGLQMSDNLINELGHKLNPFYYKIENCVEPFFDIDSINIRNILKNYPTESNEVNDFILPTDLSYIELLIRSYSGGSSYIENNKDSYSAHEIFEKDKFEVKVNFKEINNDNFYDLKNFIDGTEKNTAFSLTNTGLKDYFKYRFKYKRHEMYIVTGDTLCDFCYYYALKNLIGTVIWLPTELINSVRNKSYPGENNSMIFYWLIDKLRDLRKNTLVKNEIILTSFSHEERIVEDLKKILERSSSYLLSKMTLGFKHPSEIENIYVNSLMKCEEIGRSNYLLEHFIDGLSINYFNTPIPSSFRLINAYDYNWITDLEILSPNPSIDPKAGYTLPNLAAYSKDIFPEGYAYNDNHSVRFSREAISYLCPNRGVISGRNVDIQTVTPRIKLLSDKEIFDRLFNTINFNAQISDKGNYLSESIRLYDTLENISTTFLDENIDKVFEQYICSKSGKEREEIGVSGVHVSGTSYLTFYEIQNFIKDENKAREIIDDYLNKKILYRGYVLLCKKCSNADWYSFSAIDETFVCNRCYHQEIITHQNWKKPIEPNIYYKLNEVLYQGIKQNMKYSLLTLNYLRKTAHQSFIFSPESMLTDCNNAQNCIEIDIACILDGEIIIGEVKYNNELPKKLSLYNSISNKLNAQFVLSTFADKWDDTNIDKVNKLNWNKPPKFINKIDLLSKTKNTN